MLKHKATIILLLVMTSALRGQVTTEGTDFWFGYMDNDNASAIEVYISSAHQASVTIEAPLAGFSQNINVSPNTTELVNLPLNLMPTTEGIHRMGIHVFSDEDISVYTLNKRVFSADAAVILPTNVLGQEYYVMAHVEPPGDRDAAALESEMLIVATEDDTEIEFIPSAQTHGGLNAGVAQVVTLNAGETYQLKSEGDLSGTVVRNISAVGAGGLETCKKIAVFGGNKFTNVGGCGGNRDHLLEQMFPVSTWGKDFLFVPYQTRIGGDYLKIIASEDNTTINITGEFAINLDKGEMYVNKALDGVRNISADKPIQAAQLSRSTMCDGITNSDPFMIMLSPQAQRVNRVTFDAFDVQEISQYYLTLITDPDQVSDITVDGNDVTGDFIITPGGAYANLRISRGTHTVVAPGGVIAYVYGYGQSESFGYSAGVSLESLNLQIEGDDPQIGIIADAACVNSEISFDAVFDTPAGEQPRFDTFEWDMGDGTMANGQNVLHTYTAPGIYTISLTASKGTGACNNFEIITKELEITDIQFGDLLGPVSVCPDVEGVEYTIDGSTENSYEWEVFGGAIASTTNSDRTITVDWGISRDDAWVKLLVKNALGCAADTIQLDVKINRRLEPANPIGASEVCFLDLNSVTYFTPATAGSEYEWFVLGGTILTDNTSNTVDVQWDGVGFGEIWYREHNPTITDCEGFSDRLSVRIYDEIIPTETISDALCNGDANGSISLSVVGGKGAHSVSWSNGDTGFTTSGLTAGTYTATITDELGCEVLRDYVVGEPEVLEVGAIDIVNVRCFQEANGEGTVNVTGGTAPYSYAFTGPNSYSRNGTTNFADGMVAGEYSVVVTDANGCTTNSDFTVTEPALLEPDLATLVNLPICPQADNGSIQIDAMGGTAPYQFIWNTVPQQTGNPATQLSQGSYRVTIIDANGCEASLTLEVTERFPRVHIPTAFSPNGDGQNDEFKPVTDCDLNYSMQVFNKWGSIIFATRDIFQGWDGTYEGQDVPDGPYSYKIFYSGTMNGIPFEETVHGTVRIFR